MKGKNRMKLGSALAAALMIMMLPVVAAQEAEANANANASAQAVTAQQLKFRQFGEGVNDFFFKMRSALTFSEESKVELLQERNAELQTRQHAWIETKNNALMHFNSTDMTSEEKQEILAEIQQEHRALIREHVDITQQIVRIGAEAKAAGNAGIEQKANTAADRIVQSGLGLGLSLAVDAGGDAQARDLRTFVVGVDITSESSANGEITAEEAVSIVESQLGFEATGVRAETKNGHRFFVVTGARSEQDADVALGAAYEVWVSAETGLISSVNLQTSIKARTGAESGGSVKAESSGNGSASVQTRSSVTTSGSDGSAEARSEGRIAVGLE